jgi:hypothetical protein
LHAGWAGITAPSAVKFNEMDPLSQAGYIGMKVPSNERCNVEGSHVTIDDALTSRWYTMLSKACGQKDHRMSLPPD